MKRIVWISLISLSLLLSSCTWLSSSCIPPEASYGAEGSAHTTLNRDYAEVGESVTVTLSAELQMPNCSHLTEQVWHDLTLGACISRMDGEEVISRGGLCEPGGVPLPDGITLLNDTSHIKEFGDYVVRRGEMSTYSHTFSFTATEPGTFRLNGLTQYSALGDKVEEVFFGGSHEVVVFE